MSGSLDSLVRLLARLLLAACFVPSAFAQAANVSGFAVSLAAGGAPYASALATGGVLINVFGPAALALGALPRLTAGALILSTTATTLLLHRFWEVSGALRQTEQAVFVAHLGILSGLLLYLASGPGDWSWQGWWRGGSSRTPPSPAKKRPQRKPLPA